MNPRVKTVLRRLVPQPVRRIRERLAQLDLLETNLYVGPPGQTRRLFVAQAQRLLGYPTFIETGTYLGDMAEHARGFFRQIHTIELEPELARRAAERFSGAPEVTVHEGDSAAVLRRLLPQVETSCVFWLDAHYSGGVTARGDVDTPVLGELAAIREHSVRPHAVLIDDARLFGVDDAYPPLEAVIAGIRAIDPEFRIGVAADVIWASRKQLLRFAWQANEAGVMEISAAGAVERN